MAAVVAAVHPRISVNSICSMNLSFEEDLALWAELGVDHVGLITPKVDAAGSDVALKAVLDAGLRVSSVSCYRDAVADSIALTAAVGSPILYFPAGRSTGAPWEDAAADLAREIQPLEGRAQELGVRLAVEPTNPLRTDVSFIHSVRDAIAFARMTGVGIVLDVYSAWYERDIDALVRDNIDVIALVQLCDYRLGTFTMPNRVAVGDGDIPLERLVAAIVTAGYAGAFDLEILGPVIEEEGYGGPIARSLERVGAILERLGA